MADDFVQVALDGPGKKIDNQKLTTGAGLVYRQRTAAVPAHGTSYYDSGVVSLLGVDTELTPNTIMVDVILLVNTSDSSVSVTVRDAIGRDYVPAVSLLPNTPPLVISLHGIAMAGIHWWASMTSVINAQVRGMQ